MKRIVGHVGQQQNVQHSNHLLLGQVSYAAVGFGAPTFFAVVRIDDTGPCKPELYS